MNTHSGFAEVNHTSMYYEISGSGTPVVFINAYTLDTRMWNQQIPVLSEKYQTICYDIRGFGRSALPTTEPYSYHDDLKALLDFLQISSAHFVGVSQGAAIAIDFALTYPGMVRSLLLADTSVLSGYEWPEALSIMLSPVYEFAAQRNINEAKKIWATCKWFEPARRNKDVAAQLDRIIEDYSGWHFIHKNPVMDLDPPAIGRLGKINVPALIILGELDIDYYNYPIADTLTRGIPNARKLLIPNTGHMTNMEKPQVFNQALLQFLDEVENGA